MQHQPEVDAFIDSANSDHTAILKRLRGIIDKANPNVVEQYKWSRPVYGCPKDFCYLAATKKHVTLGFYNPTQIDDPSNLLEGTGKMMRHIKFTKIEEIDESIITKMLHQAAGLK